MSLFAEELRQIETDELASIYRDAHEIVQRARMLVEENAGWHGPREQIAAQAEDQVAEWTPKVAAMEDELTERHRDPRKVRRGT